MSDGYFEKIMKIEDKIKELCCSNQNLLKLLFYPDSNALEKPDIEDLSEVLDKNIFFNNRDLETLQDSRCLLFINPNNKRNYGNAIDFKDVKFYFDIITSNSIIEHDPQRPLKINNELYKMLQHKFNNLWVYCEFDDDFSNWNPNKRMWLFRTIVTFKIWDEPYLNTYEI